MHILVQIRAEIIVAVAPGGMDSIARFAGLIGARMDEGGKARKPGARRRERKSRSTF